MGDVEPRTLIFLIGFFALSLAIVFVVASYYYRRRKGLASLAGDLGFAYEREAPQLLKQFERFRSFPAGDNQRITNVLSGQWGAATVWLLDYSYFTGTKNASLHQYTVCALRSPDLELPDFRLTRGTSTPGVEKFQAFLARMGAASGSRDIAFSDDREFTRSFRLEGRDEARIRRFFDRSLRQQLLSLGGNCATIEGHRDTLLLATPELVRPEAARELIQQCTDLLAVLARRTPPSNGWREAAGSPHPMETRPENLAGAAEREGISEEDLRGGARVERRHRGSRAALKALIFLLGIVLVVAGGTVMYTEILSTVTRRTELLGNRLVVGIVVLVIGLGITLQTVFGPALRRSSIKNQMKSMREIEGDDNQDRTGERGKRGGPPS